MLVSNGLIFVLVIRVVYRYMKQEGQQTIGGISVIPESVMCRIQARLSGHDNMVRPRCKNVASLIECLVSRSSCVTVCFTIRFSRLLCRVINICVLVVLNPWYVLA